MSALWAAGGCVCGQSAAGRAVLITARLPDDFLHAARAGQWRSCSAAATHAGQRERSAKRAGEESGCRGILKNAARLAGQCGGNKRRTTLYTTTKRKAKRKDDGAGSRNSTMIQFQRMATATANSTMIQF